MNQVTSTRDEAQGRNAPARNDATLLPPVDVIEDATGITLYADMPGVPKDRVHLRVDGDQLTLEGEMAIALPQGMEPTHAEVQRSQ
jgi:HSP20 family molecular chaperone IbpA